MKHYAKIEVGFNEGNVFTFDSLRKANALIKSYEKKFGINAAHYGNDADGFVEQQKKAGAYFMPTEAK